MIEAALQASDAVLSAGAHSPPSEREEEVKEERCPVSSAGDQVDLELNPPSSGKEAAEASKSVQSGTAAVGLQDASLSPLHNNSVENDSHTGYIQGPGPKPTNHEAKGSKDNSEAVRTGRGKDRPGAGISSVTRETDPALCLPQCSSLALDVPSEAEQTVGPEPENSLEAKGDAWETRLQPTGAFTQPTPLPQEVSTILDASVNSLLPQSSVVKKKFPPTELQASVSNDSVGFHEADVSRTIDNPSVGALPTSGPPEVASTSSPPDKAAGGDDRSGSTKMRDESPSPEAIVKAPSRSGSVKPVRFTIAPAWQRSLSGGSGSMDGSGSRSSPTSPIRPELFEGISPLDTAVQDCALSSLDRLDRNSAAILNSALEEAQGHESPFGVKLRRTSSLLKYQAEQQQQQPEPPRPVLPPAAGTSVRDEPKRQTSGKALQNLSSGATKTSVTKPSLKEERDAVKPKSEEVAAKQPAGKAPGISVV